MQDLIATFTCADSTVKRTFVDSATALESHSSNYALVVSFGKLKDFICIPPNGKLELELA